MGHLELPRESVDWEEKGSQDVPLGISQHLRAKQKSKRQQRNEEWMAVDEWPQGSKWTPGMITEAKREKWRRAERPPASYTTWKSGKAKIGKECGQVEAFEKFNGQFCGMPACGEDRNSG